MHVRWKRFQNPKPEPKQTYDQAEDLIEAELRDEAPLRHPSAKSR